MNRFQNMGTFDAGVIGGARPGGNAGALTLDEAGIAHTQLGGVVPNPRLSKVREGAKLAMLRARSMIRRNLAGIILFAALAGFVLGPMGLWGRLQIQVTDIDRVVDAYVYTTAGERVGQTQIEVVGQWHQHRGKECWYEGRFAIPEVPKTCREDTKFLLSQGWDDYGNLEAVQIRLYTPGSFDIKTMKPAGYFAPSMEAFAVMTGEGKIIATDDYLARLMAMYPYVYRLDNVGITVWNE